MAKKATSKAYTKKSVETLKHDADKRRNIPTAEFQAVVKEEQQSPIRVAFERRNRDLDPQLVWRGKDEKDWSDLVVHAPPLYIQEKVHPKVLVDDLLRQSQQGKPQQLDLFADFNGIAAGVDKTDFYQHDQNWSNRMILGDSLQVMASLAEREGLRGRVQCIYFDPPYGIKFNSNFQWSTTSRDVKDGKADHITREPEQVKAFRDTWRDGIHSYLTYLRDRLTVARDLLTDSGSIFVQIGDENVHRVRAVMDEVFGEDNFAGEISFFKTSSQSTTGIPSIVDTLVCFAKRKEHQKFRPLLREKVAGDTGAKQYTMVIDNLFNEVRAATDEELRIKPSELKGWRFCALGPTTSQGAQEGRSDPYVFQGAPYPVPKNRHWSLSPKAGEEMDKLARIGRLRSGGKGLRSVLLLDDNPATPLDNVWLDTGSGSFGEEQIYVVQTVTKAVQRCILMATDPGDLVLDPTCGSGTTATAAEQWGRRWITIDTSRMALTLGATLYCLLTGRPPFQAATAVETVQQVLREEPVSPRRLNAAIDRDLETICLKCLEKEPPRRYQSAAELAGNLVRYEQGRPIHARPISRAARSLRWARRNPALATLATAFLLALVGGTGISTFFAIKASNNAAFYREEKDRANRETALSNFALAETEQTIHHYINAISTSELRKEPRFKPLFNELLKGAQVFTQRFVDKHQNDRDEESRVRLALALSQLGLLHDQSGSTTEALQAYKNAIVMYESLTREYPANQKYESSLASAYGELGSLYDAIGNEAGARKTEQQALAIFERLALASPNNPEYQSGLARGYYAIGAMSDDKTIAAEAYTKALAISERLAQQNPAITHYQFALAMGYTVVSSLNGIPEEALAGEAKAIAILERLILADPSNEYLQSSLAMSFSKVGDIYRSNGKLSEALDAEKRALDINERLVRQHPTNTWLQPHLAISFGDIGTLHGEMGRLTEAVEAHKKALLVYQRLANDDPARLPFQENVALCHEAIVRLYQELGRPADALESQGLALAIYERLVHDDPTNTSFEVKLALSLKAIADLYEEAEMSPQAVDAIRRAVEINERIVDDHKRATALAESLDDPIVGQELAGVFSLCIGSVARDESLPMDERRMLADQYAAKAMAMLNRSVEIGSFRDSARELLRTAAKFAALRMRPEFQALLEKIDAIPNSQ